LLVGLVLAGLMAQKLVDIYRGGHYVCPACGARDQGLHSPDQPLEQVAVDRRYGRCEAQRPDRRARDG